jgi:DNA-binding transcriptional ArsR family regulator
MQRDWDLIRIILKKIQEGDQSSLTGYEPRVVNEHMNLLDEAGLVERQIVLDNGFTPWNACRLTWQGHEFVESAANEVIYTQAVQKAKTAGAISFEIVKTIIAELVKRAVLGP